MYSVQKQGMDNFKKKSQNISLTTPLVRALNPIKPHDLPYRQSDRPLFKHT